MSEGIGAVIVGAGLAGVTAAIGLRRRGFDRPITLVNEEHEFPYDRPPLSKEVLSGDRSPQDILLHPVTTYGEHGILLLSATRVRAIDRERRVLMLEGGKGLGYEHLVLATGARPRCLKLRRAEASASDRLFYLRNMRDANGLRPHLARDKHLLVIGAGFIGLEVAACARRLGCNVTVLEAGQRVLERAAPPEVSRFVEDVHRENGVDFVFGAQVIDISEDDHAIAVHLADGETRTGDVLLAGIGALPNDDLARDAGLPCDNGIVVDQQCRTADPHVFAVGDVAKAFNPFLACHLRLEHWESALQTGEVAAAAICGEATVNDGLPWVWSDQYSLNIQFLGWSEPHAEKVVRGEPGRRSWSLIQVLDGRVIGAVLVNAGRERRPIERLIKNRTAVDAAQLADTGIALRQLAV